MKNVTKQLLDLAPMDVDYLRHLQKLQEGLYEAMINAYRCVPAALTCLMICLSVWVLLAAFRTFTWKK
jgi:hypothetical protein